MNLDSQILFFFSGLGVFNGALLSAYLIFGLKPRRVVNLLLGLLLFMLCIRIGKSVFMHFTDTPPRIYLQIGLSACFFIGPMLYLYIFSMLRSIERWTDRMSLHIFWNSVVVLVFGLLYPYENYPQIWNRYMVWCIYLQWIIYVIVSGVLLVWGLWMKKEALGMKEKWLIVLYLINVVICTFYNLAYYGIFYYIAGPLAFLFCFTD